MSMSPDILNLPVNETIRPPIPMISAMSTDHGTIGHHPATVQNRLRCRPVLSVVTSVPSRRKSAMASHSGSLRAAE